MLKRYNYRENCRCAVRLPEKGMINGQGRGDVSRLRYGICHMSFNGCEVISVYNALQYKGKPKPLPEVAAFMERYRLLMGFFGCNVYCVGRALRHFGVESQFTRDVSGAEAFIVSYWTGRPFLSMIHTVFCRKTARGIAVYNRYNNSETVQHLPDIATLIGKRKPISAFCINA